MLELLLICLLQHKLMWLQIVLTWRYWDNTCVQIFFVYRTGQSSSFCLLWLASFSACRKGSQPKETKWQTYDVHVCEPNFYGSSEIAVTWLGSVSLADVHSVNMRTYADGNNATECPRDSQPAAGMCSGSFLDTIQSVSHNFYHPDFSEFFPVCATNIQANTFTTITRLYLCQMTKFCSNISKLDRVTQFHVWWCTMFYCLSAVPMTVCEYCEYCAPIISPKTYAYQK